MTFAASLTGGISAALSKFAKNIDDSAARSGAYAGAKVLYDEMHINASRGENSDGQLADALYTWHDDENSVDGKQTYVVGVNKRKAPHWHWMEYGRWRHYQTIKIGGEWVTLKNRPLDTPVWVPASPYIRPAFDSKIHAALDAAKKRIGERIRELAK